jgi:hypothetical protein
LFKKGINTLSYSEFSSDSGKAMGGGEGATKEDYQKYLNNV